ncbi:MAG: hypothetical protein A3B66_02590 [Alphaproteobacteria bacterium RIFCSPHIGHO2_02_FULL_46_13]|nr:MAG: hypothetical protein A3B66_02590 [Alphaproteobacteria bacterium RIFCSPHIGHO2_02_FULL_46_13]
MRMAVLILALLLSACVTGERITDIAPGMTSEQVSKIIGRPDGFRGVSDYTIYTYTNRLISGWSWDRADYTFIFKDDKLVEYGPGEVREREVGGVQTIFLYEL